MATAPGPFAIATPESICYAIGVRRRRFVPGSMTGVVPGGEDAASVNPRIHATVHTGKIRGDQSASPCTIRSISEVRTKR